MHSMHRQGFDQNLPLRNGQEEDDGGGGNGNSPLDLSLSLSLSGYNPPPLPQPLPQSLTPNPALLHTQLLSLADYNLMHFSSPSSYSTPIPIAPMMWDRQLFFGHSHPLPPYPSSLSPAAPMQQGWQLLQWEKGETVSLSLSQAEHYPPPPPRPPPPPPRFPSPIPNPTTPMWRGRPLLGPGKSETIPPPYPWATEHRAIIRSLDDLTRNGIEKIRGEMKCKKCGVESKMEFNLIEKFMEVESFISMNKSEMHQRAPRGWECPPRQDCGRCSGEGCTEPVTGKKREMNWLFLLLGQMIGFSSLEHLKYLCKHTRNHRTGAKDRLVYIAYMCLCKQLHPTGPYDL